MKIIPFGGLKQKKQEKCPQAQPRDNEENPLRGIETGDPVLPPCPTLFGGGDNEDNPLRGIETEVHGWLPAEQATDHAEVTMKIIPFGGLKPSISGEA